MPAHVVLGVTRSNLEDPVKFSVSSEDAPLPKLRPDVSCYLNPCVVDPQIAEEAASVLYHENVFRIWTKREARFRFGLLQDFLKHDHYLSGHIARDHVRRIHVGVWPGSGLKDKEEYGSHGLLRQQLLGCTTHRGSRNYT